MISAFHVSAWQRTRRQLLRRATAAGLLGVLLSTGTLAQTSSAEMNPLLGTWILDTSRSVIDYAQLPQDERRTYATAPDNGMVFRVEGHDDVGQPYAYGSTAAIDGREYPMPGTGTRNGGDAVSWRLVDSSTVHAVVKKLGAVVNRVTLSVSSNGTILTITENGTNPNDRPTHGVRIYNRTSVP